MPYSFISERGSRVASAVVVSHLPSGGGCISFSLEPSQDSFSHVPLLASPGVAHKHWCISQGTCSDWRPGGGRRQLHFLYQVPNNASPEPSEAVGLAWSRSAFDQRWQHAPFPRGCRRGRRASPDPQSSVTWLLGPSFLLFTPTGVRAWQLRKAYSTPSAQLTH